MSLSAPPPPTINTLVYHHGYTPIGNAQELLTLMKAHPSKGDLHSYLAFAVKDLADVELGTLPETLPHYARVLQSGEPMPLTPENLTLATATAWLDDYLQRPLGDLPKLPLLACPFTRYTRPSSDRSTGAQIRYVELVRPSPEA